LERHGEALVFGERSVELREEGRRADPSRRRRTAGLEDEIEEVLVPTEEVIEVRRGKKVIKRAALHAWLRAGPDGHEQTAHITLINSINRVTGFLGQPGRPMRDEAIPMKSTLILNRVEEGLEIAPRNADPLSRSASR
jgi:transcription antitermination factor NusG